MAVGEPDVLAFLDVLELLLRNFETDTPTAKVRRIVNPWIGDESRFAVETDQGGIPYRFEAQHGANIHEVSLSSKTARGPDEEKLAADYADYTDQLAFVL